MNSLERTCDNGQNFADKDSNTASMTLQDGNNFKASAKGCDVWPLGRRNTNDRCAYFTLLTPDSNGNWRAVAVPFHCLNVGVQAGSGLQSFTDGTFSGSKLQNHRRSKALTNKVSKRDALPGNSVRYTSFNSNRSNVTDISDTNHGASKMRKPVKKNNAKKAKKKEKRNRNLTLDAGSSDVAYLQGSATDEAGSSKNTDPGTGSASWETASTVLSPDSCSNSSEDNCGGSNNHSDTSRAYITNVDKVDTLEANCGDLSALKRVQDSNSSFLSETNESNDPLLLSSISAILKADNVAVSSTSSLDMRHKGSRKVTRNSSVSKKSSLRKFRDHSVDKNNSSWREVSGNVTDKWSSGSGKMTSYECQAVNCSKIASFAKNYHTVSQIELSKGEDKNQSRVGNRGNMKRRTSAGSKQELNSHSRKLFNASKSTSNLCAEVGKELNNAEEISPHLHRTKWLSGISQPLSEVNGTRNDSDAEKIDSIICGNLSQLVDRSNKVESLEQICSLSICSLNDQTVSEDCKLISPHFEEGKQTELLDGHSMLFCNPTETEGLEKDNDVSAIEHGKHHQVSGSSMHKKIPVGIKDPELDEEAVESFKLEGLGRGNDVSAIEHNKDDLISGPSMHEFVSVGITDSELVRSNLSNSSQCVEKEAVESFMLENTAMEMSLPKALDRSINNVSFDTAVYNDSDKILQAVNDAYKAQLSSETVEKAIGYPIAEVEKFLRAASPLIPLSNNISPCWTCVPSEVSVAHLCRHEMSNLSLGNIWQWYEKQGTFGLEVKAEDYDSSKRLGIDRFAFCAYFVPFLSAIQLFRHRRSSSDTKNSSNNIGVPLFSVLVPQPKIVGNVNKNVNGSTSRDELELVYEYFEAERPQHRRPLFDMIKNLVSGNEPLQGRAFGDSSKLVSMTINDLHPRSWYSVAWYPIYRIPDEKFQSAFLTYHSLGHLVHARTSSESFVGNASVVSPVVGLENYNTQGECWLRPKNPPEGTQNYNPSEILRERLRTLEHTASAMARAEVVKENATSVNIQPDYEFFLARRRW